VEYLNLIENLFLYLKAEVVVNYRKMINLKEQFFHQYAKILHRFLKNINYRDHKKVNRKDNYQIVQKINKNR